MIYTFYTLVFFFVASQGFTKHSFSPRFLRLEITNHLAAEKFDENDLIKVSCMKPLGLSLDEVRVNDNSGVIVGEVNEGSAKESGKIVKGLYLLKVNNIDVRYEYFDNIIDVIAGSDPGKPLDLVLIDPLDMMKGPALLKVKGMKGEEVNIKALKGQNLRTVLIENKVEVYTAKGRISNCGGGMSCGTCVVSVTNNDFWEEVPKFEKLKLKKYDSTARLSCNTIIEGDCSVVIQPQNH